MSRPEGRFDVREAVATAKGPRSRTLVTFRGALRPEVLEAAAARASTPFDRAALEARAAELGVPVSERREDRAARGLLASLRRGSRPHPLFVRLLRDALGALPEAPIPPRLAEAAEWLGADPAARGRALRDLLRLSDRIVRSRRLARSRRRRRFPRFRSRRRAVRA